MDRITQELLYLWQKEGGLTPLQISRKFKKKDGTMWSVTSIYRFIKEITPEYPTYFLLFNETYQHEQVVRKLRKVV